MGGKGWSSEMWQGEPRWDSATVHVWWVQERKALNRTLQGCSRNFSSSLPKLCTALHKLSGPLCLYLPLLPLPMPKLPLANPSFMLLSTLGMLGIFLPPSPSPVILPNLRGLGPNSVRCWTCPSAIDLNGSCECSVPGSTGPGHYVCLLDCPSLPLSAL